MSLTYASVCSGIEAASVAWEPLGWRAQFYAEIDPFAAAVLHHHYSSGRPRHMPDPNEPGIPEKERKARIAAIKAVAGLPERANGVPNHGDFTKIPGDAGPVDILVGGTPCQSFSVAGKRLGLDDPRGNLALEYVGLAKRLGARWVAWENVPGVFSSAGGRDFADFLGFLAGRRIDVPRGGWQNSGIVAGISGAYGLAWRVLDAQFVRVDGFPRAVPQRRRRVFVVGYFGDWRRAAAVLFEPESMQWYPAPRREAGQGIALSPTMRAGGNSTGGHRPPGTDVDTADSLIAVSHALNARSTATGRLDAFSETFVLPVAASLARGAESAGKGGYAGRRQEDDVNIVVQPFTLAIRGRADGHQLEFHQDGVANAVLTPSGGRAGIGVGAIAIQAGALRENADSDPDGVGVQEGIAYTIEARAEVQAVQQAMAVRRLMPKECARLQGFPDDRCRIPWKGRPAEKCPDGPQYKGYGNSMAVPVMRWIGLRIDMMERLDREGRLA